MNLQENLKRIKEIMKLDEAETSQTSSQQFQSALSKLKSLSTVNDINDFLIDIASSHPEGNKKLVMIFPQENWQVLLLELVFFGDYAGVFRSVYDAKEFLRKLITKGVKFDDVYFGSHGGGQEGLFYTLDDDANISINTSGMITLLSQVITSSTRVMFSACGGADNHYNLKFAAENLGCLTYGSEGDFDWWNNKSEGTMWKCPVTPKLVNTGDITSYRIDVSRIGKSKAEQKFTDLIVNRAKSYCKTVSSPPFDFTPQIHHSTSWWPIIQGGTDIDGKTPVDRYRDKYPAHRIGGGIL